MALSVTGVPPRRRSGILATREASGAPSTSPHRGFGKARRTEARFAIILVLPALLAVGVFTAGPVLASLLLSLFKWDLVSHPKYVGLANYRAMFQDSSVLGAFTTTGVLVVCVVGLQLLLGLILALAVERRAKRIRFLYRAAFFFPLMTSAASVSIVMSYMFDQHFGVINYYLSLVGLPTVNWLGSPIGAMATIVIVVVWQQLGFTFILFSAALAGVPQDLVDATQVDGASGLQQFRHLTLPMISPTVLFATIVGIINAVQIFDQPYILTAGGPGTATRTVVMAIFQAGFESLQFGYAATISVFLFLAVLILTAVQFRATRRWVYYAE